VLRAERGGDVDPGGDSASSEWVRSSVTEAGCATSATRLAFERLPQLRLRQQAVDAEFHAAAGAGSVTAKQAGAWKSGFPSRCASAQ
jgi:hypothetical protein